LIKENEKIFNCRYQILSKIFISFKKDKVSLHPYLFAVWAGGDSKIWRFEGEYACCLEDTEM